MLSLELPPILVHVFHHEKMIEAGNSSFQYHINRLEPSGGEIEVVKKQLTIIHDKFTSLDHLLIQDVKLPRGSLEKKHTISAVTNRNDVESTWNDWFILPTRLKSLRLFLTLSYSLMRLAFIDLTRYLPSSTPHLESLTLDFRFDLFSSARAKPAIPANEMIENLRHLPKLTKLDFYQLNLSRDIVNEQFCSLLRSFPALTYLRCYPYFPQDSELIDRIVWLMPTHPDDHLNEIANRSDVMDMNVLHDTRHD